MSDKRISVPLGPLVSVASIQERLGPGSPQGDLLFWDCGCAARFDAGEGAWRYAAACIDHAIESA